MTAVAGGLGAGVTDRVGAAAVVAGRVGGLLPQTQVCDRMVLADPSLFFVEFDSQLLPEVGSSLEPPGGPGDAEGVAFVVQERVADPTLNGVLQGAYAVGEGATGTLRATAVARAGFESALSVVPGPDVPAAAPFDVIIEWSLSGRTAGVGPGARTTVEILRRYENATTGAVDTFGYVPVYRPVSAWDNQVSTHNQGMKQDEWEGFTLSTGADVHRFVFVWKVEAVVHNRTGVTVGSALSQFDQERAGDRLVMPKVTVVSLDERVRFGCDALDQSAPLELP